MKRTVKRNGAIGSNRRRAFLCGGFSLLELIGVMAVTAILASVILPSVVRTIEMETAEKEGVFLENAAAALKNYLRREKAFPDETGWAAVVAVELGMPVSEVSESSRQSQRVYVIDPSLRLGTAAGVLPFEQTSDGSIAPVSPRIMILSSTDAARVIPLTSGVISQSEFDTLWALPVDGVPGDWEAEWQLSGDRLKIVRVNLDSLFLNVRLNNYESANPGQYSIDGGIQQTVLTTGLDSYFVEGTLLGLYDDAGELESQEILQRPLTFTFERGAWRGQVYLGLALSGDDVYSATSLFAGASVNGYALGGATPSLAVDRFTYFMDCYLDWDNAGFPGTGSQSYNAVVAAQAALATTSSSLVFAPVPTP